MKKLIRMYRLWRYRRFFYKLFFMQYHGGNLYAVEDAFTCADYTFQRLIGFSYVVLLDET